MKLNLTKPLAFIDLETTGIDTARDRIVEIAIVKVMPSREILEYSERINPGMPIPSDATAVHGISNADVKDCPSFSQVAKKYFDIMNDCDWSGFNSSRFDFPMLTEEFGRAGLVFDNTNRRMIDVQRIYHKLEPRNLTAAYKFFCEKDLTDAHSALADTRATFEILESQLDRYDSTLKNDIDFLHTFTKDGDFVDSTRKMYFDKGIEKFNFGKHKGKVVTEVFRQEPNYFDWIMKSDFPLDFKEKLKEIKARG